VLFGVSGLLLGLTAFALPAEGGDSLAMAAGVVAAAAAAWLVAGLRAIRDLVWRVKLSVRRVIGYDLTQQRVSLVWGDVDCLEIDRRGILIRGRDETGTPSRLRVPPAFPEFSALSHRLVDYAEAYGRPIYVDGRPWQLIDLHAVYPFLQEAVPARAADDDSGGGLFVP
jgi:hypothetical protein